MPGQLDGKAGVIVGATSGLGLAALQAMTREGAAIIAVGRDRARGEAAIASVQDQGGRAEFFAGDVSTEQDIVGAIGRCREAYGRFEIMHNNAGVLLMGALHETTQCRVAADARNQSHRGVLGLQACRAGDAGSRRGIDHQHRLGRRVHRDRRHAGLRDQQGRGHRPDPRDRARLRADGIRCNAVCPGDFESPMLEDYLAGSGRSDSGPVADGSGLSAGRILQPAQVARCRRYLGLRRRRGGQRDLARRRSRAPDPKTY